MQIARSKTPVILLIEDNPQLRELLLSALDLHGCVVWTARNGREAQQILQRHKRNPDLILSDWSMPLMDGGYFIQWLRSHQEQWGIPIIVMSGTPQHAEQAIRHGADYFIHKPFHVENLLEHITQLLNVSC